MYTLSPSSSSSSNLIMYPSTLSKYSRGQFVGPSYILFTYSLFYTFALCSFFLLSFFRFLVRQRLRFAPVIRGRSGKKSKRNSASHFRSSLFLFFSLRRSKKSHFFSSQRANSFQSSPPLLNSKSKHIQIQFIWHYIIYCPLMSLLLLLACSL